VSDVSESVVQEATLPDGWTFAPIARLAVFNPKTDAAEQQNCGFAPMQGLGTRYLDKLAFEIRPWGEVRKSYTHFQDGDVLIAKVTPCFENGKAGIARDLPNGIGAGSSEFCVFRPPERYHAYTRDIVCLFSIHRGELWQVLSTRTCGLATRARAVAAAASGR